MTTSPARGDTSRREADGAAVRRALWRLGSLERRIVVLRPGGSHQGADRAAIVSRHRARRFHPVRAPMRPCSEQPGMGPSHTPTRAPPCPSSVRPPSRCSTRPGASSTPFWPRRSAPDPSLVGVSTGPAMPLQRPRSAGGARLSPFAGDRAACGRRSASASGNPSRVSQPKCLDKRRARATRVRTGLHAELNGMTDISQT
jgi:hypothetical protein